MVEVVSSGNWDPLNREIVHNSLWSDSMLSTKIQLSELGMKFIDMNYSGLWELYQLNYRTCLGAGIDVGLGGVLTEWAQPNGLELVTWDNALHDRTMEGACGASWQYQADYLMLCTQKGHCPPSIGTCTPHLYHSKCRSQSKIELLIGFQVLFYIALSDFGFLFLFKYTIM